MSHDATDEFGCPLSSLQQLRRLQGHRPNDGAPGVNHERGDNAALESAPIAGNSPSWDASIERIIADMQSGEYSRQVKRDMDAAYAAKREAGK